MHFLSADLESYISENSEQEPGLLQELTRETHLKVLMPRMITGHYQGRVLSLLSTLLRPENILEIGTYTGYSALCLAEGLLPHGHLITIDKNDELAEIQKRYFDRSPYAAQITPIQGLALDVIPGIDKIFDLVFIDADKTEYPGYFEMVLPKVRAGGVILLDNVLWSGKVVEPIAPRDQTTPVLLDFNKKLSTDPRVRTVVLPIRDGLTLCMVK
jgi:predicted O-methyltransferase YrrM